MTAVVTRTFRSGNSIAVRLPAGFGIAEGTEVEVEQRGRDIIVRPFFDAAVEKAKLTAFIAELRALPAPGHLEIRDTTEIAERPGL